MTRRPIPQSPEAVQEQQAVPPIAVDAAQLAQLLSVSVRHIRRMDSAGKLPKPLKVGKCVRWARPEIEDWIAAGAPDRRTWEQMKAQHAGKAR